MVRFKGGLKCRVNCAITDVTTEINYRTDVMHAGILKYNYNVTIYIIYTKLVHMILK